MIDEYITPTGFKTTEINDIMDFHNQTKLYPISSMEIALRTGSYTESKRGFEELSKNYHVMPSKHTEAIDVKVPKNFARIINKRCSSYQFSQKAPFNRGSILKALKTCASNRTIQSSTDPNIVLHKRPYPSPGALYPSEIYILEHDNTSYSLKHFNAIQSKLHTLVKEISIDEISSCCCIGDKDLAYNTQGAILISSVWERTVVKYGFSGYRLALIEIGIIAQQLTLILTDLGVSTLHWTGFYDDKVGSLIKADSKTESVCHMIWYGGSYGKKN